MLRLALAVLAVTTAVFASAVSPAAAAEYWADDTAPGGAAACTSLAPCTLTNALAAATTTGDVVRVMPGLYPIGSSLTVARAITIQGEDPADPPHLQGATNLNVPVVSADSGLKLTNLKITAQGNNGSDALTMKGASQGDRLILHANSGDGAKIVSDPGTTRLRNSLVTTASSGSSAALKLRDAGPGAGALELRNVTVYATASGATAIRCETSVSTSAIVNSIVRGDTADVDATTAGSKCSATNSNLRTALSPGLTVANITETAPTLDGQYKPLAGSSTVDAGVDNAANGTLDLAGATRVRGLRVDAGAYELQADAPVPPTPPADPDPDPGTGTGGTGTGGTGTTTTTTTTEDPAVPRAADTEAPGATPLAAATPPELGKSVLLDQAGTGTVLVKLPGTNRFVPLADAANLPLGTTIDTRKGAVTLSSALPGGKAQTGTFSGGLFEVRQAKNGMTDIHLRGAFKKQCARKTVARAAAKQRNKSKVRRLWASDKGGRFRTHGANSVATVRGTKWLTEDRCNGTYTKVVDGAVDVRNKRTGKVTRVKAGRSVLVAKR